MRVRPPPRQGIVPHRQPAIILRRKDAVIAAWIEGTVLVADRYLHIARTVIREDKRGIVRKLGYRKVV